ncbi:MAG: hypothetical protein JXB50_08420 [Spirochaetes bacterium]|nr:hypothetical protein [Spirochaetota bacterium]
MGELTRDKLTDSKFIIEVDKNIIKFKGCIDLQNPEPIVTPFFEKIHNNIIRLGMKEIFLDFKELNFLNSSGIKTITKWIMKIPMLPPDKKYKMQLIYTDDITWQRTSLMILTFLAPDSVKAMRG